MPAEPLPPLAHRVGGRWLLSTPLIVLVSVGVGLSVFSSEPSAYGSGGGALRWLGVWAVAVGAYALAVLALRRCFAARFERGGHLPLWLVVAIVLGAAVLIDALLRSGADVLGLAMQRPLAVRIAVDFLFGIWFGLGFVLLLDELDRAQASRRRLLERRVAVDLGDLQQDLLVQGMREACWRDVDERLAAPRRGLLAQLDRVGADVATGPAADVVVGLRELAEGSVRDISTRLWAQAERAFPRLRARDVAVGVVRREPFHPWIMALVVILSGVPILVEMLGIAAGTTLAVCAAAWVTGVLALANRALARWPARRVAVFVIALVGSQLYLAPLAAAVDAAASDGLPVSSVVAQAVAGMFTIAVVSAVGSWVHGGRAMRRSYMLDLDERQARLLARSRAVSAAAREVSRELHGSVQTKLIAAAMAGEQAIADGDDDALRAAFDEARRVLEDLGPDERVVGGVAEEVARRVALWDGLCEIEVAIEEVGEARADPAGVGRVVEEGLANAVRHGGATRIAVRVHGLDDGAVAVVVEDDGSGPADATPGLGSAILDTATGGAWSREATASGCRLTACVPAASLAVSAP